MTEGTAAMTEGVVFDAGGTLVILDPNYVNQLLATAGVDPASGEAQHHAHYRAMFEFSELRRQGQELTWLWWVDRYFGLLGLEDTASVAGQFDGGRGKWNRVLPGVEDALSRLTRAGYRLAVVSNSDGTAAESLSRAGLVDHMEFIMDSHDVGVAKPDRRIFQAAAERLQLDVANLIYVGDSPFHDVEGARAAGFGGALLIDPYGLGGDEFPGVSGVSDLPGWLGVAP